MKHIAWKVLVLAASLAGCPTQKTVSNSCNTDSDCASNEVCLSLIHI